MVQHRAQLQAVLSTFMDQVSMCAAFLDDVCSLFKDLRCIIDRHRTVSYSTCTPLVLILLSGNSMDSLVLKGPAGSPPYVGNLSNIGSY